VSYPRKKLRIVPIMTVRSTTILIIRVATVYCLALLSLLKLKNKAQIPSPILRIKKGNRKPTAKDAILPIVENINRRYVLLAPACRIALLVTCQKRTVALPISNIEISRIAMSGVGIAPLIWCSSA